MFGNTKLVPGVGFELVVSRQRIGYFDGQRFSKAAFDVDSGEFTPLMFGMGF